MRTRGSSLPPQSHIDDRLYSGGGEMPRREEQLSAIAVLADFEGRTRLPLLINASGLAWDAISMDVTLTRRFVHGTRSALRSSTLEFSNPNRSTNNEALQYDCATQ
jgi:hypothetical protein